VHALATDVAASFESPALSCFDAAEGDTVLEADIYELIDLPYDSEFAPLVVFREMGDGRVIIIGSDYSVTGTDLDRVLANVMRLARPRVRGTAEITPLTTKPLPFVDGVWTGTVTVLDSGEETVIQADDGRGHEGLTEPIDVFDLRMDGISVLPGGSVVTRWSSTSNAVYGLDRSSSLVTGTFSCIESNIDAVDPENVYTDAPLQQGFYRVRLQGSE
jgi:hypothetical protein